MPAREIELRPGHSVYSPTHGVYLIIGLRDPLQKGIDRWILTVLGPKGKVFDYPVPVGRGPEYPFASDGILLG